MFLIVVFAVLLLLCLLTSALAAVVGSVALGYGYENTLAHPVQLCCYKISHLINGPFQNILSDSNLFVKLKLFHSRVKNIFCWSLLGLEVAYA